MARPAGLRMGLACQRRVFGGLFSEGARNADGRDLCKIPRMLWQGRALRGLMDDRRAYTGIYGRAIRRRCQLQLQGSVGHGRLHDLGRLLESGILSQPKECAVPGTDGAGRHSRAGVPHAGQRPGIAVRSGSVGRKRYDGAAGRRVAGARVCGGQRQARVGGLVPAAKLSGRQLSVCLCAGRAGEFVWLARNEGRAGISVSAACQNARGGHAARGAAGGQRRMV